MVVDPAGEGARGMTQSAIPGRWHVIEGFAECRYAVTGIAAHVLYLGKRVIDKGAKETAGVMT